MSCVCDMAFLCGSTLVKIPLLQADTVVIWPQMFKSDIKPKQTNKQSITLESKIPFFNILCLTQEITSTDKVNALLQCYHGGIQCTYPGPVVYGSNIPSIQVLMPPSSLSYYQSHRRYWGKSFNERSLTSSVPVISLMCLHLHLDLTTSSQKRRKLCIWNEN